uniref:EGF-like domain-containing protein n=1 Tax=Timema cristinae TaxID=61476 RepID=A0A7R9DGB9_TIMCR|nr:unnamed protein product [Timema cristinae]
MLLTFREILLLFPEPCLPDQFTCDNGHCIPNRWKCDTTPDCDDGSDEPLDCVPTTCKPGQFKCQFSNKCIPHGWLCDGESDCGITSKHEPDNSDEDQHRCMNSVVCTPNYYRCDKSVICLPITTLCDSVPDCPDNSDEQEFCETLSVCLLVSGNTSICSSIKCEFGCKPSSSGPLCYCDKGWQPNGTRCVDFDDCLIDGSCDQHCTNTVGSYSCSCSEGYRASGHSCFAGYRASGHSCYMVSCSCGEGYRASGHSCYMVSCSCGEGYRASGHSCYMGYRASGHSCYMVSCSCGEGYRASGHSCYMVSCSCGEGYRASGHSCYMVSCSCGEGYRASGHSGLAVNGEEVNILPVKQAGSSLTLTRYTMALSYKPGMGKRCPFHILCQIYTFIVSKTKQSQTI